MYPHPVVFHLIWLDLIVFGCLLLFLSVSEYINVSDGEDRDPPKKYVIGLCCVLFYVICYCMLLHAVYGCSHVGDGEGRGIHQRNIGRFGSLCRRLIKLP